MSDLDVFIADAAALGPEPDEVADFDQHHAAILELFRLDGVDLHDPVAVRAALSSCLYTAGLARGLDATGHLDTVMDGLAVVLARIAKEASR